MRSYELTGELWRYPGRRLAFRHLPAEVADELRARHAGAHRAFGSLRDVFQVRTVVEGVGGQTLDDHFIPRFTEDTIELLNVLAPLRSGKSTVRVYSRATHKTITMSCRVVQGPGDGNDYQHGECRGSKGALVRILS